MVLLNLERKLEAAFKLRGSIDFEKLETAKAKGLDPTRWWKHRSSAVGPACLNPTQRAIQATPISVDNRRGHDAQGQGARDYSSRRRKLGKSAC
jgi:hypothetical protein